MRIGFDAKRLFYNNTGLGVYSRLLVDGLAKRHTEHRYILFAHDKKRSSFKSDFTKLKRVGRSSPLWRSMGMTRDIRDEQCDIYHGLSHELPIGIRRLPCKTVVTIHDVIFKVDPTLYPVVDRTVYDWKWKYSTKVADQIIAVSQHTKSDILKYYNVPEQKIKVIPPPIYFDAGIQPTQLTHVAEQYKLPSDFILFVGSITPRKNILGLLKALSIIPKSDRPPLVIVGRGNQEKEGRAFADDHGLSDLVQWVGHIKNTDLPAFYHLAKVLVYPSFYEGFGIPIVESLLCHTPVITSNSSSMPEAGGPGALLTDPKDPSSIADAIGRLYDDTELAASLVEKGHSYVQRFSVKAVCTEMEACYRGLM